MTKRQIKAFCKDYRDVLCGNFKQEIFCENFLKALGAKQIHSLDASNFEGAAFSEKLIWFFVHANNRKIFVIRKRIYMKDVLHTGHKFGIFFGWDTPVFVHMRLKFIFFNITRMVSLLTGSATPFLFTSSVSSSSVQRA